jgi:plastocyanin
MKVLATFALLTLLTTAGCSDAAGPGSQDVSVTDNAFSPSTVTVTSGATVTWTWNGSNQHNVTWVSGTPAASATQSSGSYQRTFDTPGTYAYYCTIHGSPTGGMRGTVVVQ